MSEFFKTYLQTHSEILGLYILVIDPLLHEFAVEGQLSYSATNSPYNFAYTISSARYDRPEEGINPSHVPACFEFICELGRIAQNIQAGSHSHKGFHYIHFTNAIHMFLLERSGDFNRR